MEVGLLRVQDRREPEQQRGDDRAADREHDRRAVERGSRSRAAPTSGSARSRRRAPTPTTSMPRPPPRTPSTRLSVMNWRTRRRRLAPSAWRTATSRVRVSARASRRFAMLTIEISSTNSTAPCSSHSVVDERADEVRLERRRRRRDAARDRASGTPSCRACPILRRARQLLAERRDRAPGLEAHEHVAVVAAAARRWRSRGAPGPTPPCRRT